MSPSLRERDPRAFPAAFYLPSYILRERNTVFRRSGSSRRSPGRCPDGYHRLHSPTSGPPGIRFFLAQVPAGGIGKEKAVSFLQAPFSKVMQLVGFALPDEDNRKPAAALTAAAAGAGYQGRLGGFHGFITDIGGTAKWGERNRLTYRFVTITPSFSGNPVRGPEATTDILYSFVRGKYRARHPPHCHQLGWRCAW